MGVSCNRLLGGAPRARKGPTPNVSAGLRSGEEGICMHFESENVGSAGLVIRVVLEIGEHHVKDLMRWPMGFAIENPGWVIDEPLRFRAREWTAVVTMNADPKNPGVDPGRPDAAEVEAAVRAVIQPLEDKLK